MSLLASFHVWEAEKSHGRCLNSKKTDYDNSLRVNRKPQVLQQGKHWEVMLDDLRNKHKKDS